MDNLIKEGEQMMDGGNQSNNSGQGMQQGGDQQMQQGNDQQDQQGNQQQSSGGGGFMKSMESTTEDAYINQEANKVLTKEGLPTAMDGAVDGAIDVEANKLQKDF